MSAVEGELLDLVVDGRALRDHHHARATEDNPTGAGDPGGDGWRIQCMLGGSAAR
jgi:hypothetical protein